MGNRILQKMEKIQKFRRRNLIFFFKSSLVLLFFYIALHLFFKNGFIVNISKSLPLGIYRTYEIKEEIKTGDLVVFIPNKKNKDFMIERGYLDKDNMVKTLMKKVVGTEGDIFTVEKSFFGNDKLFLRKNNEENLGIIFTYDRKYRELPHINYIKLKKDEYFLIGQSIYSYDSRYFGVVKREEILYKAKPIFVF